MTADEIAKMIPPEVVEAGARELCERDEWKVSWDDLEDCVREFYIDKARAACLALLQAWPGVEIRTRPTFGHDRIILPLPAQDARDD